MDGLLQQMMQGEIRTQVCTVYWEMFDVNCTVYSVYCLNYLHCTVKVIVNGNKINTKHPSRITLVEKEGCPFPCLSNSDRISIATFFSCLFLGSYLTY